MSVANDGSESVQIAITAKRPFDLIIIDINMPVMDGIEASYQILQHFKN